MLPSKIDKYRILFIHSSVNSFLASFPNAVARFLRDFPFSYLFSNVSLDEGEIYQDDCDSIEETILGLQRFMESPRLGTSKIGGKLGKLGKLKDWGTSRLRKPPHIIIFTDSLGSVLIKGVSLKYRFGIPTNTKLILFFRENETPGSSHAIDKERQQGTDEHIKRITTEFDTMVLKKISHDLNSMTWASILRQDSAGPDYGDSEFWRMFQQVVQKTVDLAYPMLGRRFGLVPPPSETVTISGMPSEHFSKPKPYEEYLRAFIQSKKRSAKTSPDSTTGEGRWKALRDQAQARLESGDNEHALAMFQQCLTMRIPHKNAIWEIRSSLAFARMMLGRYAKAESDLSELRQELSHYVTPNLNPDITDIHGVILLNYALALSRMGNYKKMKECLYEIVLPDHPQLKGLFKEEQGYYAFAATVCRLRALAVAQQGYLDSTTIDTEMKRADGWCGKLADVTSSEPVRISNTLNQCRVNVLRGHYTNALSSLESALVGSILGIGETNPLTIETALLCSFLQIETGCVRQGRITCERCADVIEETLGNAHPLALEAEHILISASYQEGAFVTALKDAISLCHRAESSTELGYKHPSTLKYKCQLGELYIEIGLYSRAQDILAEVRDDAEQLWGPRHPDVLRTQSQLALAQYHLGKLEIAEKTIFSTLYDQLQLYLRFDNDKLWLKNMGNNSVRQSIRGKDVLHHVGQAFKASHDSSESQHNDGPAPHPDILHSLLTCAKILSREPNADLDLALDTFHLVRELGVAKLGQSHSLPLLASLRLGEVLLSMAMGEKDDEKRQKQYNQAMSSFDFIMGPDIVSKIEEPDAGVPPIRLDTDHPIFLATKQEQLLASLLFSEADPGKERVFKCKDDLDAILTMQRGRPGPGHRQTVKTLLTLLTIALSFSEPLAEVVEIYEEIVEPLTAADVEQERFLECLLMRERVAGIIESRTDLFGDAYHGLMGHIQRQLREGEANEDPSVRQAVRRVMERTSNR